MCCLFFTSLFAIHTSLSLLLSSPKSVLTLRVCADLSVREECDEDPNQSDEAEAEMSPPKSPSTPKNVKAKNSGTVRHSVSPARGQNIRRHWTPCQNPQRFGGALPTPTSTHLMTAPFSCSLYLRAA